MAVNRIQLQAGMSLAQFLAEYGTVTQCEAALQAAKWPDGFVCPNCAGRAATTFRRRNLNYWQCSQCHHQASLTAGTLFEHTQLPLTTWFLALYLISQSKSNIAALELSRHLGVSWKTAWLLKHKIMEAMYRREQERPLHGAVSLDDAYLGGERRGSKPGRGSENKIPFVAAVEMRDGKPGRVRFDPVAGFTFDALRQWAATALAPGCVVATDGLIGFSVLETIGHVHRPQKAVPGKAGCEVAPFAWLNTILGNLKTALSGTHHAFKFGKYAHRYLADVQYRLNRRFDMASMVQRLLVAAARTTPCPKKVIQMNTDDGT